MKLTSAIKFIVFSLLLCISASGMAQTSRGDKLFLEGQTLQKTQTISSQNAAIKKFQQAKIAYTTADKKSMCDNQINICQENIKRLSKPKTTKKPTSEKTVEVDLDSVAEAPTSAKRTDVSLALGVDHLDFKATPKDGATQSVTVNCNYEDWAITSKPDWVSVYIAENRKKFNVEVMANETEQKRSGVIMVQCEDKTATLVINQEKEKLMGKLKKAAKSLSK